MRRSFDTPAYRGQSCWANLEGLIAFMSAYRDAMTNNIYRFKYLVFMLKWLICHARVTEIHEKTKKQKQNKTKNERDCVRGSEGLVQGPPRCKISLDREACFSLKGQSHELRMSGPKLKTWKILQNVSRLTRLKKDGGCKWQRRHGGKRRDSGRKKTISDLKKCKREWFKNPQSTLHENNIF